MKAQNCGKAQNYIFYAHGVKLVVPQYTKEQFSLIIILRKLTQQKRNLEMASVQNFRQLLTDLEVSFDVLLCNYIHRINQKILQ